MTKKQIAYYVPTEHDYIVIGERGEIFNNVKHPRLMQHKWLHTTKVLAITPDGFETQNTLYKKWKEEK